MGRKQKTENREETDNGLGIKAVGLERLLVGYSQAHRAWTFPARDWRRRITGCQLRGLDGKRWAIEGSRFLDSFFKCILGIKGEPALSIFCIGNPASLFQFFIFMPIDLAGFFSDFACEFGD